MAEYFKQISEYEKYTQTDAVLERTRLVANRADYKLGYWMQSFMRLFMPGIYLRSLDSFGELENWMQLRYLMEHATFEPTHPLYNLDYEECSAEDRRRLDVFREIAFHCCYCWYYIVKKERPNLLPKKERKPLTKKEERYLRWMEAYYADNGTWQQQNAFSNILHYKARELFPPKAPTEEEIEAFDKYESEIQRQQKQSRKLRQSKECKNNHD